jgi:hypothetical protein
MSEPSEPFDEFGPSEPAISDSQQGYCSRLLRTGLRTLSGVARWVAILSLGYIMIRHALPLIVGSQPLTALKSAIPLMAIGFSYICLVVILPRTPGQRVIGISVGLAFILWGLEQYLPDQRIVALIDDVVVFLFVLDLAIVVRHNLKSSPGEKPPTG